MDNKLDLLSEAFGLTKGQRQLLLRVAWVLTVSTILAYILGALTIIGIAAPYANAEDVDQLKQTVEISARINLAQELRMHMRSRCQTQDERFRDSLERTIESLQAQYSKLTGSRYPDQRCAP